MSVKTHEAFSIDSQQDRLLWWDDFLGDQLKDEWRTAGTGSAVVVDAQTGGIVRITTGAVSGNNQYIDWNDIRSLLVSKRVSMEVRLKVNSATYIFPQIYLYWDATHYIRMAAYEDVGGAAVWTIRCRDTGDTFLVTTNALDTDYHIFRIECFPTGEVHFYIDGVECDNSPITVAANIPNEYLQPYIRVDTTHTGAQSMDIDYVVIRQEI